MKKIIDYKILIVDSLRELEQMIKHMILDGWQPYGNISKLSDTGFLFFSSGARTLNKLHKGKIIDNGIADSQVSMEHAAVQVMVLYEEDNKKSRLRG